jgi:hypothetical protein
VSPVESSDTLANLPIDVLAWRMQDPPDPGLARDWRSKVWHIDNDELLEWLGAIGAKAFLLLFLAPFLILTTASVYALVASQLGSLPGLIGASGFVAGVANVLNRWLGLVRRHW